MGVLEVRQLSHQFADKQLYEDAHFELNTEDHMGIIGQNGAGKSTLIKIITGQELPDEGEIKWKKSATIGYLDQYAEVAEGITVIEFLKTAFQRLYDISDKQTQAYTDYAENLDEKLLEKAGRYQEELEAKNFYDIDTEIDRVRTGLGLDAIEKDHQVSELSGGQRSKIILAKLLLENPEVILLDEPTNYLDTEHIDWLTDYLNQFEGCFMVISHDFEFLQNVTNTIIDVAFGKITKYRGNFKAAIKQKEAKKEAQLKAFQKQRLQIEKDEAYIRKNKAGTRATMAKSRQKRLDKIERVTPPSDIVKGKFDFPYLDTGSASTLAVKNLSVGYKTPLLSPVTFSLSHQEKVVLKGFNGIGKSTMIKSILKLIPTFGGSAEFSDSVVVNYFDQDLIWDNKEMTPLQIIQDEYPDLEPKTIRRRLAKSGINAANTMKPIGILSGGEQMKVKLSLVELKPSNFLILDEPTNHLDDDTKDALQRAVRRFPGNVLLVSHESPFYESWIDKVFDVEAIRIQK
ncbi:MULTISPECIES: ABC-F family ATP-binding cassette domain-containing protein [Dellaglioa]|uniref:ABC transporter ATP-binding protein n=1 Tax=Dellaglioa algida DSM 15638 TaxID=1423719 RepID=A0A0R1HNF5_9LACO|nr:MULTISPECIES: ABC-F family ATP-binding cassette domain-containing protein [Dellaglioa]KRK45987.1 ABC transporter ATP-binding protein [Dellaglioa algida DSM 15638]MCZ2493142.1 ATP-binding cassette domain-containing protein [Dellaglioa carnosa]MDK1732769.1 ATP-binding cassette domain-containing protein [Dellaglioa algida]MDK1734293.1 ATP-binding cassette domain-containing protein [Dellaglioa algida]